MEDNRVPGLQCFPGLDQVSEFLFDRGLIGARSRIKGAQSLQRNRAVVTPKASSGLHKSANNTLLRSYGPGLIQLCQGLQPTRRSGYG